VMNAAREQSAAIKAASNPMQWQACNDFSEDTAMAEQMQVRQEDNQPTAMMVCSRQKLSRSLPLCPWNLLRLLPRLIPGGFFAVLVVFDVVHFDSPLARDMTTHLALAVVVLFVGIVSYDRRLDLPPLKWRKRAHRTDWRSRVRWEERYNPERGAGDTTQRFRCPGCEVETAPPLDSVRYRCRSVEFEVRGLDVWVAAMEDKESESGVLNSPALGEDAPTNVVVAVVGTPGEPVRVPAASQLGRASGPSGAEWTLLGLLFVLFVGIYLCMSGSPLVGGTILSLCLVASLLASSQLTDTTGMAPPPTASLEELSRHLESHRSELPEDAWERLVRIKTSLHDASALLNDGEPPTTVQQTVRDAIEKLVPDAVSKYVALPRDFREHARLLDGQTARENLVAQLALLERELEEARLTSLHARSRELLVHSAYLKGRFPEDAGDSLAGRHEALNPRKPNSET